MDAPLEALLQQVQKQSVAHAIHFIANQSETYYEAVRRAAHLAGARPEMFLLRAVFALDLTRIAVPRGGAIPLASLPNAATEHPKLRRAVPQAFAGLEPSFQETLQRLVTSIDVNRQFVVWLTIEGEGLGTHDLGRSVHTGVVIDALDHRPTWVGHLGGRTGSAGDNNIPPHRFQTTADGRVVPEPGAQQQQQQMAMMAAQQQHQHQHQQRGIAMMSPQGQSQQQQQQQQQMMSPQQQAQLAAAQARYGSHVSAIPSASSYQGSPWGQQQQQMQQMQQQQGGATPPMSALSALSSSPSALTASGLAPSAADNGASPSTHLSFTSPNGAAEGIGRRGPIAKAVAAGGGGGADGGAAAATPRKANPNQITAEQVDKIDEYLAVSHMCTKASTKCIEQLGTFNVRLDELHNYTQTLQSKFEDGRKDSKALSTAVEGLMTKVQSAEKHMLRLEAPPKREAPKVEKKEQVVETDPIVEDKSSASSAKPSSADDAVMKAATSQLVPKSSNLDDCPYCKIPHSKFCPETGRRHETAEEKTDRRWKHIFRQLSMASSFVSNVRLSKKNTMTDAGAIELLL